MSQTTRVSDLQAAGKTIIVVDPVNGRDMPSTVQPSGYAAVDLSAPVATSSAGEPVYVARDGYNHTRVVVRG